MWRENKRRRLTFEEKREIIEKVKAGSSKKYILQEYGITDHMYRRLIARESDPLDNKVKYYEYGKRKSLKTSNNVELDAAMFEWFKQARDRGDPISGPIIKEKALILNVKLNGPETFQASNGWLHNFKKRYGIRNIRVKAGEQLLTNDTSYAAEFSQFLKAKIESEHLNFDNIYNADELGILWRLLMACSLPLYLEEEEALGRKEYKDRVTALFCANATGSHRIPLLMIGKSETPQCLSNLITKTSKDLRLRRLESLGVTYTYQSSAWMDRCIFMLWYKDEFIPRVLEYQRRSGITGKVILLLDNAASHPSLDELNAINKNFEVIYLPPNVTASIQPMDQGVIAATKILFKKSLLTRIFLGEKPEGALEFIKELNLRDLFAILSLAWDSVKSPTLQKAWKPLLGDSFFLNNVAASANIQDPLSDVGASANIQDPLSNVDADVNKLESPTDSPSFPHEIFFLNNVAASANIQDPQLEVDAFANIQDPLSNVDADANEPESRTDSPSFPHEIFFLNNVAASANIQDPLSDVDASANIQDPLSNVDADVNEPESPTDWRTFPYEAWDQVSKLLSGPDYSVAKSRAFILKWLENDHKDDDCGWEPLSDSDVVNLVKNGKCVPKIVTNIEESEPIFESPEPMGTTSSEAFGGLMKFKHWLKSRAECLPKHLCYIKELESLQREYHLVKSESCSDKNISEKSPNHSEINPKFKVETP